MTWRAPSSIASSRSAILSTAIWSTNHHACPPVWCAMCTVGVLRSRSAQSCRLLAGLCCPALQMLSACKPTLALTACKWQSLRATSLCRRNRPGAPGVHVSTHRACERAQNDLLAAACSQAAPGGLQQTRPSEHEACSSSEPCVPQTARPVHTPCPSEHVRPMSSGKLRLQE